MREISSKSQGTDIVSKEAFRSDLLPDYNEGAAALMGRDGADLWARRQEARQSVI